MAVPLVLVAGAGVLAALALLLRRVGWPRSRAGEATLAVVGPLAALLGVLGAAGLLTVLVDLTSPTLLPLALAYAAIPGLLVLVVGSAAAAAPAREAGLVPVAGVLVLLAGVAVGGALPVPDGAAGLIGLGFLLVAAPAPLAVRDPGWEPPAWLGRGAVFATAALLGALVLFAALVTAGFGEPRTADFRWQVTVEAPPSGSEGASFTQPYRFGVHVPFLTATDPAGEDVLAALRDDVGVTSEAGGTRLLEDGRIVEVLVDPGQTVTVAADLVVWGRPEHTSATNGLRLPTRNVTVSGPVPSDAGNLSVTWTYAARGNGCSIDAKLQAQVPAPGNATLTSDDPEEVREGGGFQGVCT